MKKLLAFLLGIMVMATMIAGCGGGGSAGVDVDSSNDRAWRQTQLKVAELLIERQPEAAVGYRLRRHAVWAGITAVPMSGAGNKTPLAPMSADMVDEYRAAMNATRSSTSGPAAGPAA